MSGEARDLPCPECGADLLRVKDSRYVNGRIRRRRECIAGHRATTYELLATSRDAFRGAIEDVESSVSRLLAAVETHTTILGLGSHGDGTPSGEEAA